MTTATSLFVPRRFVALLCLGLTASLPLAAYADTASDAETLLNWAEMTYATILPTRLSTQATTGYLYRGPYASANGAYYIGVTTTEPPHVVALNANDGKGILDLGTLTTWLTQASASSPGGTPPSGTPPTGTPPGGTGSLSAAACVATYTLTGGTAAQSDQSYTSSTADTSGVCVESGGKLTLSKPTVTTSGETSSQGNSSFFGLNAGILATSASNITITGGSVTTTGGGGNGIFATGSGTSITVTDTVISATGQGGHGIMATLGATLTATNVTASSTGMNGSIIATDRGGGTITVKGGTYTTSGIDSAGIYTTGTISATGVTINSGAEAVVVEGANTANVIDSTLTASKGTRDRGLLVFQSMSGDADVGTGNLNISGGSYTWPATTGPAIYVTNTSAVIKLTGVAIHNSSATLIKAGADQWGTSGANGGQVDFTADGQTLTGDIVIDAISTFDGTLKNNSTLTGAINNAGTGKTVKLTLDATSTWNVGANSMLSALSGATISGTSIANIVGNGHTVTYDASLAANSALGGKTYTLSGGGTLKPKI